MSLMKMRKSVQKDSWLTRKFQEKPSVWRAVGLSALTVLLIGLFLRSSSSEQAMAFGGGAAVAALLAFDTWRRLRR